MPRGHPLMTGPCYWAPLQLLSAAVYRGSSECTAISRCTCYQTRTSVKIGSARSFDRFLLNSNEFFLRMESPWQLSPKNILVWEKKRLPREPYPIHRWSPTPRSTSLFKTIIRHPTRSAKGLTVLKFSPTFWRPAQLDFRWTLPVSFKQGRSVMHTVRSSRTLCHSRLIHCISCVCMSDIL